MSDEETQTEETPKLVLEVDKEAIEVDDLFLILESQAKILDPQDPKNHLAMLNLLDRVVVGGIRGRGIKSNQIEQVFELVGQALGEDNDIKN